MAKTFNPNRVGGGTVSIVRAADGTYSLKEEGFQAVTSLNMIDLGDVAKTTTTKKTETATEKTETTTADQTKAAFMLPKGRDKDDDPFTFEKSLKSATDVSKGLSEVETVSDRQKTESQLGATEGPTVGSFGQDPTAQIKSPTGPVFGRTPLEDDFKTMVGPKVETPQEKLKLSAAEKEKRKPEFLSNVFSSIGEAIKGDKFKTEKGSEVNVDKGRGSPLGERYRSEVAQAGSGKRNINIAPNIFDINERGDPALNVGSRNVTGEDPYGARTLGISTVDGTDLEADAGIIPRADIQPVAKKTFAESVGTALKGVGTILRTSPTLRLVAAIGIPTNESASTTAFNKGRFNVVTSPGSMQGRIVGDDGTYDPANNLFHGMNRSSKLGNLENAGQKRIDRINKTLSKKNLNARTRKVLTERRDNFERELDNYRSDKNNHNIKSAQKKGVDTSKLNPNEMRNVAQTGNVQGNTNDGGGGGGRSKIVCTMMNESYGFGSFRNKIWLRHSKNLAPEYQRGYHRLFLPLVKKAKTNKILKKILEHIAVHRTIDIRQQERNKIHLIGRVYRTILEPICYWAGKK